MSTQRKHRGLFWWGLRLGLLAVVIAMGVIAWQTFRPAMGIERQLVGTWHMTYTDTAQQEQSVTFTLTPGRRGIADGAPAGGRWYMKANRIYFPVPLRYRVSWALFGGGQENALELTFEDEDTIVATSPLGGMTSRWERVPD